MSDPIPRLNAALEGRYRVERELGEGGMATVYLADDLRHERKVALKVLKPELAAVVGASRFIAEIKTTANLQHPNILPLFDSGEADDFLFYVMPYVEGESLRERLEREGQLPVADALKITTEVADALQAAHEQGVIHRDIKPANILLSRGRPLVADFGIALAVSAAGGGRLTETGLSLGTPYYMSPEQASADREPTASSDVYSLACVLYEMLVGEPPHTGSSAQAVLAKILTSTAPAASKSRPNIPANVDATIRKALEKLPADRFSSARGVLEALSDPGFRHVGGVESSRTSGTDRPRYASFVAAAGIALGAIAGWLLHASFGAPEEPGNAAIRLSASAPGGERLSVQFNNPIAISPDGSQVVFIGTYGETTALYLRALNERSARRLPGTEGARDVFFSHDGHWIGFLAERTIQRVSIDGGRPLPVLDVPAGDIVGATWGEDDVIIFAEPAVGLGAVSAAGGERTTLTTVSTADGEFDHTFPILTPDGRTVLFTIRASEASSIAALSLETGQWTAFRPGSVAVRYLSSGHLVYPQAGALVAEPFDLELLRGTGPAQPILDSVVTRTARAVDMAFYDVSRSGALAYIHGQYSETLSWLDPADGSLTPWAPRERGYWYYRLSPNERQIAAVIPARDEQDEDIWILDTSSGRPPLKVTEAGDNTTAIWTPDGSRIAFASNRAGDLDLYWQEPNTGVEPDLLLQRPYSQFLGSWSPDGQTLVFGEEHPETGRDIWALDVGSTSQPRPLLTGSHREDQAVFSPNGAWLAYTSDETGSPQVYVMAMPSTRGRRPITVDGGTEPQWSRDGRELYFRRGGSLWRVGITEGPDGLDTEPPEAVAAVASWYDTWFQGFDIAADGRLLVISGDVFTSVDIVTNWLAELPNLPDGQ